MNRESERKRLVELMGKRRQICKNANCGLCGYASFGGYPQCQDKKLADILLDNGLIIPKYEIGQKFYTITPHGIYHSSYEICGIQFTDELRYIYCDVCDDDFMSFGEEDVGKTIFFSEEAEKALERKEDEGK